MITEEKKLWAIEILQKRSKELGKPPQKADFDEVTLSRIKAFLGPWPRALETAGLKEIKNVSDMKKQKKIKKRKKTKI